MHSQVLSLCHVKTVGLQCMAKKGSAVNIVLSWSGIKIQIAECLVRHNNFIVYKCSGSVRYMQCSIAYSALCSSPSLQINIVTSVQHFHCCAWGLQWVFVVHSIILRPVCTEPHYVCIWNIKVAAYSLRPKTFSIEWTGGNELLAGITHHRKHTFLRWGISRFNTIILMYPASEV